MSALLTDRLKRALAFEDINENGKRILDSTMEVIDCFGCGSHSCRYIKPTGMGVNGPCRCQENLKLALTKLTEIIDEMEKDRG